MNKLDFRLSSERLFTRLDTLGAVGATPEGGVRRLALSDADKEGRDLVTRWMKELGLSVRIDHIGNIFGLRTGQENLSPVMTGSHIDTVFNGGNLDGNLGVLAGLEVIETLNEAAIETRRPIVVAVFTNEEGARFQPDMMGSLVYAGGYDLEKALNTADDHGIVLGDELQRIGYAGDMACGEVIPSAFVELHIEQGPILEQEGVTLGAVENLQGISWTEVIFSGQANHAGTTPMHLRHDAGYCAGALASFIHDLAKDIGEAQVATIGVIELEPNIINVVPGRARVTVDLRHPDNARLVEAERRLQVFLSELTQAEGVVVQTKSLARFDPVQFDHGIARCIEENARALGHSCRRMTSGAGHDAQMMSRICPTAMIFTPSIDGVSHNPAEATTPEDVMAGANVLLHTLLDLSQD
ncbi:MAG: Zn-dependent hydrolase [Gammaproteobacteria bacterium]